LISPILFFHSTETIQEYSDGEIQISIIEPLYQFIYTQLNEGYLLNINYLILLLFLFVFGFAPFLSYFSLWNPQWSFQMHSCNFPDMYVNYSFFLTQGCPLIS
jgi:hypothetical protein